MTFAFVVQHRHVWPVSRMCNVLGRLPVGLPCLAQRPISARARPPVRGTGPRTSSWRFDKSSKPAIAPLARAGSWCELCVRTGRGPAGCTRIERLMPQKPLGRGQSGSGNPKDVGARSVVADNIPRPRSLGRPPEPELLADFTYIWTAEAGSTSRS